MLSINNHVFLLINAPAGASPSLVSVAEFVASRLIDLIPVLLVVLWVWGKPAGRAGLVASAVAAALALGANQLVGLFWYEPRPFMIGLGRTLIAHVPENSFPSDHTTFILAVGFALIATRATPQWGGGCKHLGDPRGMGADIFGTSLPTRYAGLGVDRRPVRCGCRFAGHTGPALDDAGRGSNL